uniref:Protein yippee-like n=1 Tax=Phaeomonas parva TaxID=124430 RepID=A0A7S1UJY0_9STRA|mmetsp:Transcript_9031/g.26278  ORF Transcript_9031/g.26278 Transcript_9031/m.26278 type:complete len:121 (+) Transcript_9031:312-674(+)
MGRIFRRYLEGPKIYCCEGCGTHLSTNDQIISRAFHGRGGRAFLFNTAINVSTGPPERRMLITGMHVVADIYCIQCQALIGWTYEQAFEPTQKYKEGKFILEKTKISKVEWSDGGSSPST